MGYKRAPVPSEAPLTTSIPAGSSAPDLRPGLRSIGFLGDAALAELVAAGDERAFEVLYERHRGELFRYCAALLRHAQDAEEALQLTMLAAYRAMSRGARPRLAVRPWLFRIAHNECVDLMRARPPHDALPDDVEPPTGSAHERVEMRERIRELNADIAALPVRQRSALVLHEMNGLSHAAVGQALGTTAADARRLLHEARVSLAAFGLGASRRVRTSAARSPTATAGRSAHAR